MIQRLSAALLAMLLVLSGVIVPQQTSAADLTTRSVRVQTSTASAVTSHTFQFDIPNVYSLGSMAFEYCANSPLPNEPCVPPVGLAAASSNLVTQTGETGFSKDSNSTNNRLVISRTPSTTSSGTVSYRFNPITNPNIPNRSTFVRVSTYASSDGTGPSIDFGGLVFSTASSLNVSSYVPPYLTFCAAITVTVDCSSSNGYFINLGELSTTSTRSDTSQMSGATNDPGGISISMLGTTMTSGNNIIDPMTTPTPSLVGNSQWGINLRANAVPSRGAEPDGAGTITAANDFNLPNRYSFQNTVLASSPVSTDFKRFTVTYIANVPRGQPAGVYATTFTYVATAAF